MDSLYDRISHGTISVDEITASMERSTSAGGKYFQSMEKQSQTVAGQFSTLKDNAASLAGTLANGLSKSISGGVLPAINDLIAGLEKSYSEEGLGGFAEALGNGIANIFTKLVEDAPKFIEVSVTIIESLIKGIDNSLPELIPALTNAIFKIIDIVAENIDQFVEAGIKIIIAISIGLIKATPKLIQKIPEIIKGIVRGFLGGISQFKDVGKELMNGLWQGIKNKWEGLKNSVSNLGKGIVNKFKSVFGIHSPSRVFRDQIGKYLASGIGVGFNSELENVYSKMQNAINAETGKMSANVQTTGSYQMAIKNPVFNLLDNTNNTTQLKVDGKVLAEVVNTENRKREVARA